MADRARKRLNHGINWEARPAKDQKLYLSFFLRRLKTRGMIKKAEFVYLASFYINF